MSQAQLQLLCTEIRDSLQRALDAEAKAKVVLEEIRARRNALADLWYEISLDIPVSEEYTIRPVAESLGRKVFHV